MRLLGYARVSRQDGAQDPALQLDALARAGCAATYEDRQSGATLARPELQRLIADAAPGDVMVVWKLDRASRSLKDLLHLIDELTRRGVGFRSLTEPVDTTTPAGRMFLQLAGAFAEFERGQLIERTRAGIQAAKSRGVHCGRSFHFTSGQEEEIAQMVEGGRSAADVARLFRVNRSTIGRILQRRRPFVPPLVNATDQSNTGTPSDTQGGNGGITGRLSNGGQA